MSIQDAVDSVQDSDTIYLTPGIYTESGIKIDKNITLQGMGNTSDIIIDGNHANTIILVNSVSKVKFFNITFINGKAPEYGGAIHSELGGQIYVDSCDFINNTAGHNGGAIDIAGEQHRIKWQVFTNYGFLNATNCNFINNKAGHDGGALATYWGNSYVYNSYFTQNYAERDGGALRVGIYSTTTTENCTFDNNTAKEWGGALYNWPGELTVNNCTISNNYAGTQGGAMITSGPLTVTNSKITNNKAERMGGVIFIAEETPHIPSTVVFENNIIEGNTAKRGSLVYVDETTAIATNFNGNSWDIDPTSDDWAKAFITNDLIDMPTQFIDDAGNLITVIPKEIAEETTPHVPQEKPDHNPLPEIENTTEPTKDIIENTTENDVVDNTTQTNNTEVINENTNTESETNNPTNIIEEIVEAVEEVIDNVNIQSNSTSTNIENNNIGLSETPISSQESADTASENGADDSKTAHEITKNDVAKKTTTSPIPYVIAIIAILAILVYGYTRYNKNDD